MGSPVDDALDRLDSLAYDEQWILDALATVRQEVERLTKERGELGQAWVNAEERLRAAEVEVQRLTEERDALREEVDLQIGSMGRWAARAEAAEAEVRRLTEGLREQGEPIMDERFRDRLLRHVLSNEEVGQLVDAIESRERRARALLAASPDGAKPEGGEA